MTAKNSRKAPAPSTRAASYSSSGIFCTPATNSTMQSPKVTQVPMTPIDGSAHVKSPSQGRTSEPSPTTLEQPVERAGRVVDPHPRLRDHDARDQLGRKSVVRKKRKPRIAVRVSAAVRSSPMITGITA